MIPVRPSRAPTSPRTFTGLSFQRSKETGSNAAGKVLTEEIGSNPIVRTISRMLADVSTTTASPSTSGAGGLAGGGGMLTVIPATDPNFQYIGRMQDGVGGAKMFDMPGCEIRTRIEIAAGTSPVSMPGISASVQTCLRADVFRLQPPLIRVSPAFICHTTIVCRSLSHAQLLSHAPLPALTPGFIARSVSIALAMIACIVSGSYS
jgi:hypothetical protein